MSKRGTIPEVKNEIKKGRTMSIPEYLLFFQQKYAVFNAMSKSMQKHVLDANQRVHDVSRIAGPKDLSGVTLRHLYIRLLFIDQHLREFYKADLKQLPQEVYELYGSKVELMNQIKYREMDDGETLVPDPEVVQIFTEYAYDEKLFQRKLLVYVHPQKRKEAKQIFKSSEWVKGMLDMAPAADGEKDLYNFVSLIELLEMYVQRHHK